MEYSYSHSQLKPNPFSAEGQALVRVGLWMRAGLIGASAVAIGIIMLTNGDARPQTALSAIVVGGVLAVFAWRRSWIILDSIDWGEKAVAAPVVPVEGKDQPVAARRTPREIAADWAAG